MSLPITVPLSSIELEQLIRSDVQPTPPAGYEVCLVKDLTYTKLWLIYKVTEV